MANGGDEDLWCLDELVYSTENREDIIMKKGKYVSILMVFILIGCIKGQYIKEPYTSVEKIVEVPGYTQNEIFDQTKIFIAENFRSAKAVMEYENRETGTIIGNGNIKYPTDGGFQAMALSTFRTNFTIRVDIKDGRLRCIFSNIKISWPSRYDRTLGASSAGERSITDGFEQESVSVKNELLKIPDEIAFYIKKSKTKDTW